MGKPKKLGPFGNDTPLAVNVFDQPQPATPQPAAPANSLLGKPPTYVPPPGNVHDFSFQQARLAARNQAFLLLIPFVDYETQRLGYIVDFEQVEQAESDWVFPILFYVQIAKADKSPYVFGTVIGLNAYTTCRGDALRFAKFLISQYKFAPADQQVKP